MLRGRYERRDDCGAVERFVVACSGGKPLRRDLLVASPVLVKVLLGLRRLRGCCRIGLRFWSLSVVHIIARSWLLFMPQGGGSGRLFVAWPTVIRQGAGSSKRGK